MVSYFVKLNSRQLRVSEPDADDIIKIKRNEIYFVIDNVLDTYNIGSLFRLADAIAAKKIFICGASEYPPNSRIHKAAVGTENWTPWEKVNTTLEAVTKLKNDNVQIISVEQNVNSVSYKNIKPRFPCAIVIGHETSGVSDDVLRLSDIIVEIPMCGINKSFNVWGTAAVISYKILESII